MKIIHLPEEVIRYLQPFLSHDDYHYLMNSSKLHFQSLKKQTIYFNLQTTFSHQFLEDRAFQRAILSKVIDGRDQIGLNFGVSSFPYIPRDLPVNQARSENYGLTLQHSLIEVCHVPRIEGAFRIDVLPDLSKVKELALLRCCHLPSYRNLSHLTRLKLTVSNIEDISDLQHIPFLNLTHCQKVTDYTLLNGNKQKELIIDFSHQLKVVDNFKGIHKLFLNKCSELENITPLKGIYDLTIRNCPKVRDLSSLGGHYRIEIFLCSPEIIGFESLVNIPHVSLGGCDLLLDLTPLRYATSVKISRCSAISDVTGLRNVKSVTVVHCKSINDLTPLEKVIALKISCVSPPNIGGVRCKTLGLSLSAKTFRPPSLNPLLKELTVLTLNESFVAYIIKQLPHLHHLQALTILSNRGLRCADGLGDIPTLRLIACDNLADIRALGRNRCVEIRSCKSLRDISSLKTVPIVTIEDCDAITDFSCLKDVPRLKIVNC